MSVYCISELGVNANGSIEEAERLIEAAAIAGADAAKGQHYHLDELYAEPMPPIADTLRKCAFTLDEHRHLKGVAEAFGIDYFVSVFGLRALEEAVSMGVSRIKLGSGELTDHRLLRAAAETGLPLIISTGMSTEAQVGGALAVVDTIDHGPVHVTLMDCVSAYPAPVQDCWLKNQHLLRGLMMRHTGYGEITGTAYGLSHHAPGIALPIAAVALGATVIEAHLTLNKDGDGPDHRASLDPSEFRQMVVGIRQVEAAMGDGVKRVMPSELSTIPKARKVLSASRPVAKGEVWTVENLTCLRAPGVWRVWEGDHVGQYCGVGVVGMGPKTTRLECLGIEADQFFTILGQKAQRDYAGREPLAAIEKELP